MVCVCGDTYQSSRVACGNAHLACLAADSAQSSFCWWREFDAQFPHGFLSNGRGSARFRDHRCYRRLGWLECVGHSRNRETDWCFREHAPQSGYAPTNRNQGSCQSREDHRSRRPRTTPCSVEAAQIGLVWCITRCKSSGNWARWVDIDPFEVPSDLGAAPFSSESGGSVFVRCYEIEHIVDQGDGSEFTLADAGHFTVWSHNFVAITHRQPDEEETPTNEQLSALNVRVVVQLGSPYTDFAVFTRYAQKHHQTSSFHRLLASAGRLLAGERDSWLFLEGFPCGVLDGDAFGPLPAENREAGNSVTNSLAPCLFLGRAAPPMWDAGSPWSAIFLKAAEDDEAFWDDNIRHPATSWLANAPRVDRTSTRQGSAHRLH